MRLRHLAIFAIFFLLCITVTFAWVEAAQRATWIWNSPNNATTLYSVKQTSDGGYIAVGYAGSDGVKGRPHGIYLVKLNNDGKKVWDKWWGRTDILGSYHSGYDVIETDDGSYVLTGKIIPSDHIDRLIVIMVDSKGSTIWEKMIASPLG